MTKENFDLGLFKRLEVIDEPSEKANVLVERNGSNLVYYSIDKSGIVRFTVLDETRNIIFSNRLDVNDNAYCSVEKENDDKLPTFIKVVTENAIHSLLLEWSDDKTLRSYRIIDGDVSAEEESSLKVKFVVEMQYDHEKRIKERIAYKQILEGIVTAEQILLPGTFISDYIELFSYEDKSNVPIVRTDSYKLPLDGSDTSKLKLEFVSLRLKDRMLPVYFGNVLARNDAQYEKIELDLNTDGVLMDLNQMSLLYKIKKAQELIAEGKLDKVDTNELEKLLEQAKKMASDDLPHAIDDWSPTTALKVKNTEDKG